MSEENKELVKRLSKILVIIIVIAIIIFLFCTVILSIIVSVNIGFNITTSNDWIGYYGIFIGAIITSIISIIGIYLTLEYYRGKDVEELNILKDELELLKEQANLAVLPYFTINKIDTGKSPITTINITNNINGSGFTYGKSVELKNIGNGAAINCYFNYCNNTKFNDKSKIFGCAKNDIYDLMIKIREQSFELNDEQSILLCYQDLKGNDYEQEISVTKKDGKQKYIINIDPPKLP